MLDTLTLESFTPHVGGAFRLSTPEGTALTLTLDEARSLASPGTRAEGDRRKREPFRLLFRGPSLPILPQGIYPLEHAALGRLEIFIVPIGPGQYEAIFTYRAGRGDMGHRPRVHGGVAIPGQVGCKRPRGLTRTKPLLNSYPPVQTIRGQDMRVRRLVGAPEDLDRSSWPDRY